MRIRHLGIVVQDLDRTAEFYENVLGFKRLGDARTPGHYPGKALDLSDGEVNYSLLQPSPEPVLHVLRDVDRLSPRAVRALLAALRGAARPL